MYGNVLQTHYIQNMGSDILIPFVSCFPHRNAEKWLCVTNPFTASLLNRGYMIGNIRLSAISDYIHNAAMVAGDHVI